MHKLLGLRIRRWYFKLLYAAVVWVAGYPFFALTALGAPPVVADIANMSLNTAGVLLGARIFRGKDEPDEPARPWWKMTAKRRLSRVFGILALVVVLASAIQFAGAALGYASSIRSLDRMTLLSAIVTTVSAATLAFLYLNSAARLPKPERRVREPQFRPKVMLK